MFRVVRVLLVLSLVACAVAAALAAYVWRDYAKPGPLAHDVVLVIEPGTPFRGIVAQLSDAGVLRYPLAYQAIVALRGEQARFKAGEYRFGTGIRPVEVTHLLVEGKSITHSLTVPEGRLSADIRALLEAETALTGDVPEPLPEGSLLPETYFFLRHETRAAVVDRMRRALQRTLSALWESRQPGLPLASPDEALILASIVEKETGVADERGRVAAVFINRLRAGMPLQSDPTTLYGIYHRTGIMKQVLSRQELTVEDPFNTYAIRGLPPSPICHPGRASLEAVLQPPATRELYFVADGAGGHRFAETLAEHNRNVVAYRMIRRRESSSAQPE
jgi:UPF0755 protein